MVGCFRKAASCSRRRRCRLSCIEHLEGRVLLAQNISVLPDVLTVIPAAGNPILEQTAGALNDSRFLATFGGNSTLRSAEVNSVRMPDQFFPISLSSSYTLSGFATSGDAFGLLNDRDNQQSLGFAAYDADFNLIEPQHVLRHWTAVDTTLAAPLNPGDRQVVLASAAGWSNANPPASRNFAWFGYSDSEGNVYADYSYTRNVAFRENGLWAPRGINGNVITLRSPWSGPALPAGAAVRNATGTGQIRDAYNFSALDRQAVPGDWTWHHYKATISGVAENGLTDPTRFAPGTEYIRPVVEVNAQPVAPGQPSGHEIQWRDIELLESSPVMTVPSTPIIDLTDPENQSQLFRTTILGQREGYGIARDGGYSFARDRFSIDAQETYTLAGWTFKVPGEIDGSLAFASYDADGLLIHPLHVTRFASATDTTFAETLSPGDTSFFIADATGWSDAVTESASTRAIAWYGYTDSTGHMYADYTYTRNIAFDLDSGLWSADAISFHAGRNAWEVLLNEAWDGPAITAGTAVRNAQSGSLYQEQQLQSGQAFHGEIRPGEYREFSQTGYFGATIGGGYWPDGTPERARFRPGTVTIQPVVAAERYWYDVTLGLQSVADARTPYSGLAASSTGASAGPFLIDVLANDPVAATLPTIELLAVSTPSYGKAAVVGNHVEYDTSDWFVGTDEFTYTVRDIGTGDVWSTSVILHFLGENVGQDAAAAAQRAAQTVGQNFVEPTAVDTVYIARYHTVAGEPLLANGANQPSVITNDFDQDGDQLFAQLVSPPAHGVISFQFDGTFEYVPDPGFVGVDSFRYEVFDGQAFDAATAMIEVQTSDSDVVESRMHGLGLGLHNYHDVYRRFPTSANPYWFDDQRQPNVSWRVHILQFIGYEELYNRFDLRQPWDSPHNLALLDEMPDIFRSVGDPSDSHTTRFQFLSADDPAYFGKWVDLDRFGTVRAGSLLQDFRDGTNNTFLFVETGVDLAIEWTRPEGFNFDPLKPHAWLGSSPEEEFRAVLGDGTVVTLPTDLPDGELTALTTLDGQELIDAQSIVRREAIKREGIQTQRNHDESVQDWKLQQLSRAMHNYNDAFGRLPVEDIPEYFDANGRPYLSWRVHLLRLLGHWHLFQQFHLDEPWDSPHNLALAAQMPDIYRSVGDAATTTTTRFQVFRGNGAPFGNLDGNGLESGPRLWRDFHDELRSTILIVETGADRAVPWTAPEDIDFDPADPMSGLGTLTEGVIRFIDAYGIAATTLRTDVDPADFAALVTHQGGELVDGSSLAHRSRERSAAINAEENDKHRLQYQTIGMHNYHHRSRQFPVDYRQAYAGNFGPDGRPFLSWRVYLLLELGYEDLYFQFHLDEPWDSPHNLSLLDKMPDLYRSDGDAWDSVKTRFQVFTGSGAPFYTITRRVDGQTVFDGPSIRDVTDGTSNTLLVARVGADKAIEWTRPDDIVFDPNDPFAALGDIGWSFLSAYMDGAVRRVSSEISDADLNRQVTFNAGDALPPLTTTVTVDRNSIVEGGDDALVTLTRSNERPLDRQQVYFVHIDDATEARGPIAVGIPVGAASVTFPVTAIDDDVYDGTQTIRLSVSSWNDFVTLDVIDNDSPSAPTVIELNASPTLAFHEDQPRIFLVPRAVVTDPDTPVLESSTLRVRLLDGVPNGRERIDAQIPSEASLVIKNRTTSWNELLYEFNELATPELVTKILQGVRYGNGSDAIGGTRTIEFAIAEGPGPFANPATLSFPLIGTPDRPELRVIRNRYGHNFSYREDDPPLLFSVDMTDPDEHPHWEGGRLNVRVTQQMDSFDRLTICSTGTGPDQISLSGTQVLYEGMPIGTFNGGIGTNRLQVNLNDQARTPAVQALLRAIEFTNLNDRPAEVTKEVRFELTDPEGYTNNPYPDGVAFIDITPRNDIPVITSSRSTTYTIVEGGPFKTIGTGLNLIDPDYSGGGTITARKIQGDSSDHFQLLHQGFGVNQVGVDNDLVYFSGMEVGSLTFGTGSIHVRLHGNATRYAAQSIMRVIQYRSDHDNPAAWRSRRVEISFFEVTNASAWISLTINMTPVNDPPSIDNYGPDVQTIPNNLVRLVPYAGVTDPDSHWFSRLNFSIASGFQTGDHFGWINSSRLEFSNFEIRWDGILIATWNTTATMLDVQFVSDQSGAITRAVLRQAAFSATSAGTRTISAQVEDEHGAVSAPISKRFIAN